MELPPADTEAGRAFRRDNAAAIAMAEREALLTRLAEEERRALVGRYASAMAHEVNNPLGGLFNAVRMIVTIRGAFQLPTSLMGHLL